MKLELSMEFQVTWVLEFIFWIVPWHFLTILYLCRRVFTYILKRLLLGCYRLQIFLTSSMFTNWLERFLRFFSFQILLFYTLWIVWRLNRFKNLTLSYLNLHRICLIKVKTCQTRIWKGQKKYKVEKTCMHLKDVQIVDSCCRCSSLKAKARPRKRWNQQATQPISR